MDNNELMDAITWYQQQGDSHPLTCGIDSRHDLLVPRIDGNDVVLVCPTCGNVQQYIPEGIVELHDSVKPALVFLDRLRDAAGSIIEFPSPTFYQSFQGIDVLYLFENGIQIDLVLSRVVDGPSGVVAEKGENKFEKNFVLNDVVIIDNLVEWLQKVVSGE